MSAEYLIAKEAALDQLRSACVSNLRHLQENGVQAEFSFRDHWQIRKQDRSTHPQIPVLSQLSRTFLNFYVHTWVDYSYRNGGLSAELFQNLGDTITIGPAVRSVQLHESIDVEDIPFDKFSERDLLNAAQTIRAHLQPIHAGV